jgi:hypothetical protein
MKNIGKEIVEKYCKHQGYGNYTLNEEKLAAAINDLVVNKNDLLHSVINWAFKNDYIESEYTVKDLIDMYEFRGEPEMDEEAWSGGIADNH